MFDRLSDVYIVFQDFEKRAGVAKAKSCQAIPHATVHAMGAAASVFFPATGFTTAALIGD